MALRGLLGRWLGQRRPIYILTCELIEHLPDKNYHDHGEQSFSPHQTLKMVERIRYSEGHVYY